MKSLKAKRGLRALVIIYLGAGFLIAGLNQGLAPTLPAHEQEIIYHIYMGFENIMRGSFVILGALLTLAYLKTRAGKKRRTSLLSFSISAAILLLVTPIIFGYWEFMNAFMPFPWSSLPLQLLYDGHFFSLDVGSAFGGKGVPMFLAVYLVFQLVAFTGVFFLGRRWFCAQVCPNIGCHAETFGEVLPLVRPYAKGREQMSPIMRKGFMAWRWPFFLTNLGLLILWLYLLRSPNPALAGFLRSVELLKYLLLELLLVQAAYFFMNGRTYCYYCPAGTFLNFISRLRNHHIVTNRANCISCGKCNQVCEMGIDIASYAKEKRVLRHTNCVGCGHCIDACPIKVLDFDHR